MKMDSYLRILKARWRIVAATTMCAVLASLAAAYFAVPMYTAKTRLYVSAAADPYQGGLAAQQRVTSYVSLATDPQLLQQAINELHLTTTAADLAPKVTATAIPEAQLFDISVEQTDAATARDIANAIAKQLTALVGKLETSTDGAPPAASATVVQAAELPSTPTSPKPARDLMVGAFLGLLLGIAGALLVDRRDNTVKDRETLERVVGSVVIGTIPYEKDRVAHPAIDFRQGFSPSAEAYRQLRTNLQFLNVDRPPRVLTITSSIPGEGKTTTALNLAIALAESNHSVALVEGDLRRPRAAAYLGMIGSVGLTSVLAGQASLDDVLQPTAHAGITLLAAGPLPPNPSELLGSWHAQEMLKELRQRFDYVLIDCSPLLPVTDAAVMTAFSDGALMVVRYGSTKREPLARAAGNLHDAAGKILGCILAMAEADDPQLYESYYASAAPPVTPKPVRKQGKRATSRPAHSAT